MKSISILGSVGSIGKQTLDVIERNPGKFRAVALASFNEVDLMEEQAKRFRPKMVSLADADAAKELKERLGRSKKTRDIKVYSGSEGLLKAATCKKADTVVTAVVGSVGLLPTLEAIRAGKDVAVANKETLVCAGSIVMREVKRHGVTLMPIDSEHSAIFQCLQGQRMKDLKRIILTCSGGPFKHSTKEQIENGGKKEALGHPTWTMGPKITIDSATLMNKGLEVIEAHWLYGVPYERIDVVIHPQSIIHSMVEFRDGSILAQIGVHDMRVPIQYALSYPKRMKSESYAFLDLVMEAGRLDMLQPDKTRFPCLAYAYEAGKLGGTMPAVMNAANEIAVVEGFLKERIKLGAIPAIVKDTMNAHKNIEKPDLDDILKSDAWARKRARSLLDEHCR